MGWRLLLLPLLAAACAPVPADPARAARACAAEARAAAGPTGGITLGASSDDGPFVGAGIGVSADYLAGRDPEEVYESCVARRTGAAATVPLSLA